MAITTEPLTQTRFSYEISSCYLRFLNSYVTRPLKQQQKKQKSNPNNKVAHSSEEIVPNNSLTWDSIATESTVSPQLF